jgi:hypothetical protein
MGWKFIPIAMIRTIASTPMTEATDMGAFLLYTQKPNTMAIRINSSDTIATDALDAEAA